MSHLYIDKIFFAKKSGLFLRLILILLCSKTFGQQDAQYTQYMYNTISVNPAYAGSRDAFSVAGLYRNQWVGIGGAPVTQTFNIHAPMGRNNRVGLGLSIVNDKIGPTQETFFDIDFSYTINTSDTGQLAFGLKGGGNLLNIDFQKLNQYTNTDLLLNTNIDKKFAPNVGAGIYYHTPKFYLGLSVPNLLETKHFNELANDNLAASFLAKDRVNYYVITGYAFTLSEELKFKPALLCKAVSGAPLQLDVSANFLFYEKITLGAAYRWSAAVSTLIGFQLSRSMLLGLAYDSEITGLGNTEFNGGSYEFFLRYEIFKDKRVLYPRFF